MVTPNNVLADEIQREFLLMPIGLKGSGYIRYAAAMYFHQRGALSSKSLEIFRSLAKDDHSDLKLALQRAGCIGEMGLSSERSSIAPKLDTQ